MTALLGFTLAAGVLLLVSPWLWPPTVRVRPARRSALRTLLAEAGVARVTAPAVVTCMVVSGVMTAAIVAVGTRVLAFALVVGVAGALLPIIVLRSRRHRLAKARRAMWPDICDLLVASVRAGMSLPDSVSSLARIGPNALRPAFAQFDTDMRASGNFDASAVVLKARLADAIADRIIETLRMARRVGGTELTVVLRQLSESVRAESQARAEVEARQSWTRGAAVLGLIAPWAVLGMLSLRPEGARAYGSAEGMLLVLGGAAVSFVAYRVMLRVGRLPDPKRWLA